jgi:haloalkane dehalogenase
MTALRTPDERFASLPDFAYAPHYLEDLAGFEGLRLHFVDEGSHSNPVALCLHGQPTWSYLYRRMIPPLLAAGYRVVAPDLFGFGRSDKPIDEQTYTFEFHRETLRALIDRLDLDRILLVCQDWGGILGLTLPMDMPHRFERLLVMNTVVAAGDFDIGDGFRAWRAYNAKNRDLAVGRLIARACPHLTPDEIAAYDAPFPDANYKAGVRRFPDLVPDRPDAPGAEVSRRARDWWRNRWTGTTFMAIGMQDPVIPPPAMYALAQIIRGCPPPLELIEAGHFVQEWGDRVVDAAEPSLLHDRNR